MLGQQSARKRAMVRCCSRAVGGAAPTERAALGMAPAGGWVGGIGGAQGFAQSGRAGGTPAPPPEHSSAPDSGERSQSPCFAHCNPLLQLVYKFVFPLDLEAYLQPEKR